MSLVILRFLAMTIAPSITAAARPATTFFSIQIVVAILVAQDMASLPPMMTWLVAAPTIIVAALIAGLETVAEHDSDVSAILQEMHVDRLTGALSAFTIALILAALGLPEAEAVFLLEAASLDDSQGLLTATTTALTSGHGLFISSGAILAAVGINLGLTWLRSRLLSYFREFKIGQLWAWIETGGVLGLLILLPFLPLITFAFLVAFVVLLFVATLALRGVAHAVDQRARQDCSNCDYQVRVEASICPRCNTHRAPKTILSSRFRSGN